MASDVLTLGDLMLERIREETWPIPFEIERRYLTDSTLLEIGSAPRVGLYPRELDAGDSLYTRATFEQAIGLNIGFQQKVDHGDQAELDPLVNLVDAVWKWFLQAAQDTFGTTGAYTRVGVPGIVLYSEVALQQYSEFRSIITTTYMIETTRG